MAVETSDEALAGAVLLMAVLLEVMVVLTEGGN